MLDLQDSTFVWDQQPALAREVIDTLDRSAKTLLEKSPRYRGKIGNFTGDGYLLLFELPEHAINFCARLIAMWEEPRQRFERQLGLRADKKYLVLRSGVEFGRYHRIHGEYVGSAINRAQRCEAGSKKSIDKVLLKREGDLPGHFAVYVTQSVRDNIQISNYHVSRQLEVEFKGIEDYDQDAEDYTASRTFIYALWPRSLSADETEFLSDPSQARKVAEAISLSEASAWLLGEADGYIDRARGKVDEFAAGLIEKSIGQYSELLRQTDLPEKIRSSLKWKLGDARRRRRGREPEPGDRDDLEKKVEQYQRQLSGELLRESPDRYAFAQGSLGDAFLYLAGLVAGPERADKLERAIRAYEAALSVYSEQAHPSDHARLREKLLAARDEQVKASRESAAEAGGKGVEKE
jgi:class 3 adenylate cyclase